MAETQYTSTLTGPELDEALRDAAGVDAKVEQAQSAAQQAAQSASSAQGYASAASGSASQASTSAGQAAESAADASGLADAAAASARQAAASAASIEGDVEQASSSASAAAQSATQASGSASAAAQSASAAADSEDSVQQNAAAAQQAAAAASQSKSDAEAAASNAASSASTAQQAASLIEENLSAIQAAPSNAQAAQQAAAQAAASASAAEDAAERAEQIADFDPADFATAEQGQKADTALQPGALDGYAQTDDIPDELPNPQALTIRLGSGSPTTYDGSAARSVTVTPAAVGAAQEPLTGNLDDVTPAQVRASIQAGRQVSLLKDDNILSAWVDTGANVQCLYGWDVRDDYTGRSRAIHLEGYYGNPSSGNTWQKEDLYVNVLPKVTTANNGQTVTVQNGQWQLGEAGGGGGAVQYLVATGLTTWASDNTYQSASAAGYDLLGIVCLCNGATAEDEYSPIQWFPIPEQGETRKYGLFCMGVNTSPMGEGKVRMIPITNNANNVQRRSETPGYYYNWANRGQENRCAVPAFLYGMKF